MTHMPFIYDKLIKLTKKKFFKT
uniref:Uncharacterized protein n=1 Tax=Anguilla anguilla TaxID=7936 RepID=A0A0E9QFI1_ANGAN